MVSSWKRWIVRYFGSTKNFLLWIFSVLAALYFIDHFILTKDRINSLLKEDNEKSADSNGVGPINNIDNSKKIIKAQSGLCGLKEVCPAGKYPYFIKSGQGKDLAPRICFNGIEVYHSEEAKKLGREPGRGVNVAVFNEKTLHLTFARNFDTYESDKELLRFFQIGGISGNAIVLAASFDEASKSLSKESKENWSTLGSTVLDKLEFRDNFAMIGQRGLSHGTAIEQIEKGSSETGAYGNVVTLTGCISVPMGQLLDTNKIQNAKQTKEETNNGDIMSNCGVQKECGKSAFSVHLYSGRGNEESPKICINGKYVFAKGLNDAGRGFNIAVVNPMTKSYSRIGRFDTYLQDSSNLEIFLEMLNEGDIILAVVNDDASRNLGSHAKQLFESYGSAMIKNLTFRDSMAFVGQRGINGYTSMEELEFSGPNGKWPRVIDKRLCVPTKLKGTKIRPDPMSKKNEKRRKFCSKYDGYEDFCEGRIDEALTPSPITDPKMENNAIFDVPIIVIPGLNQNSLRMQLETLLMQPGIKPQMVTVMYDEKFPETGELSELFSYKKFKLAGSTKYSVQMQKALENVWSLYPSAKHVIVLEEEVIVSSNFLSYHSQLLPILEKDDTLAGINAWNPNGFKGHSAFAGLVTRTNYFPGYGFLLKKLYYNRFIKNNFDQCCSQRSWNGWQIHKNFEVLTPDVSRVFRRPFDGLSQQANMLSEFLNKERVTNMEAKAVLKDTQLLEKNAYNNHLKSRIKSASVLDTTNAEDCLSSKGLGFYIPAKGGNYVIFFEQPAKNPFWILNQLCRCFGLFFAKGYNCPGLHENTLRFTQGNSEIILVGSKSLFYDLKGTAKSVQLA